MKKTHNNSPNKAQLSKIGLAVPNNDGTFEFYSKGDILTAITTNKELLAACKAQHAAIDHLFAILILQKKGFLPSKSGEPWAALLIGNEAIKNAEAK